jgi:hypothetical protein
VFHFLLGGGYRFLHRYIMLIILVNIKKIIERLVKDDAQNDKLVLDIIKMVLSLMN